MNDPAYVNSTRGRIDSSLNRNGSESGSWREIYGQEAASRSAGNVNDPADAPHNDGSLRSGKENMDAEHWIHRDKLAKIESEELHQAAVMFQRMAGIESRTGRGRHHESQHNSVPDSSMTTPPAAEHSEPWPNLHDEQPVPFNSDDTYESLDDERQNWDLRRPEEIAADMDDPASSIYRNPALRKSSSRIPISTASPAPIFADQYGRESRKQRSRAPTNADEDGLSIPKPRRASEPMAADSGDNSTATGGSRPASRGTPSAQNNTSKRAQRGASGSTSRKTSAPPTTRKTTPRSRATSGNGGSGQRPATRSGESRPNTAVNRPEGDPPWLATMYKPDPRLPPDQQILPTHARKMQQEQWAKEGKTPSTYGRDFAPLAVGADEKPRVDGPEKDNESEEGKGEEKRGEKPEETQEPARPKEAEWPLGQSKEAETSPKPGANTGYSTIPKVQEPPQRGHTPNWNPPVVTAEQHQAPEKKGCGCCIVM